MSATPITRAQRDRAAAGDAGARVEQALRREAPALLAYLQRRVRPAEDAADLLSETMVVAWRRPEALPAEEREARMWLFGVARNVLSGHRRGQMRRSALAAELRAELVTRGEAVGLGGRAEEDPRVEVVRALVADLPEVDREILGLVVWEGFALAEVAAMLGMPAGTVRSRYSRARATLRSRLQRS